MCICFSSSLTLEENLCFFSLTGRLCCAFLLLHNFSLTSFAANSDSGFLNTVYDSVSQNGMIAGIVGGCTLLAILGLVVFLRRRRHQRLSKYDSFEVSPSQVTIKERIATYSFGNVLLVKASSLRGELGRTVEACAKQLPSGNDKKDQSEREHMLKEARGMMRYALPQHDHVRWPGLLQNNI